MSFAGFVNFMSFVEGFEKVAVSAEAVFAGDGVFENGVFEGFESKSHVAAEENESTEAREVLEGGPDGRLGDNGVKGELAEDNGEVEGGDIEREEGLFGEAFVGVEDEGNKENGYEEAGEFGEEVVGVEAVEGAVIKAPEEGRGESDFDMLPSGFVDGGEEADDTVLAG